MCKLKEYFSDWTKFELVFLITGLTISILSSIIFNGNLVGPLLLLVNDIYGSYNWRRMKLQQKTRN